MAINHAEFKKRLLDEIESVASSLMQAESSAATVVLDQSMVGRVSRMDAMQQQAMAVDLRNRLELRKRKLLAALARLDTEQFGLCCECELELEPARLQADPATVFCAACAAEREADKAK